MDRSQSNPARPQRARPLPLVLARSLWDADHILPVAEGGGECDLENLRTLCLRCHRAATRELRERLRRTVWAPALA